MTNFKKKKGALLLIVGGVLIFWRCAMASGPESIKSVVYHCANGSELNLGGWWAEPIKDPANKDSYYFCGGNVTADVKNVSTNRCVKVNLNSCQVTPLRQTMSTPRQDLRPICLSGQCYLFGGNTFVTTQASMSVDRLTAKSGELKQAVTELSEPRLCYAAAAIDGKHILITGGYGPKDPDTKMGVVFDSAVLVDTAKKTLMKIPMLHRRGGHSITKLPNGTFLILGGTGDDEKGAETYNPNTKTFEAVEGKMTAGRKDHRAILASDGYIYIFGGTTPKNNVQPTVIEVFDPKTRTFFSTNMNLSEGREDSAAVYIPELDVIVTAGGEIRGKEGEPESAAIDVIDLNQGRVISSKLPIPMDETQLLVRRANAKEKRAKVLVIVGQKGVGGAEVSLPAAEINIAL